MAEKRIPEDDPNFQPGGEFAPQELPPDQGGGSIPGQGEPQPGEELPPDLQQGLSTPDDFTEPIPEVPLSMPPSVPGISGLPPTEGVGRSFLPPPQKQQRKIVAGPGTPGVGGINEDQRLKLIKAQMGL